MVEYIDRNLIKWYGCDYENADCENRECSGCSHAECSHAQVMQIPTADVIEHSQYHRALELIAYLSEEILEYNNLYSKIDEAIDELRKEIEENHLNVIDYADGEWIVKDFVYGAIDRFKEKIALDK